MDETQQRYDRTVQELVSGHRLKGNVTDGDWYCVCGYNYDVSFDDEDFEYYSPSEHIASVVIQKLGIDIP